MADIRISARPQVDGPQRPVLDRAVARRQDYGSAAAASGGELEGLVRGLAVLNPALEQYGNQQFVQEADQVHQQARALAESERISNTQEAQRLAGNPLPSSVPPAFGKAFRAGYLGVLSERTGAMLKSEMATEYNQKKDEPDFDLGGWMQEFRGRTLKGFMDPEMVAKVGPHLDQMEVAIRSDAEKVRLQRQQEAVDTSLAQTVRDRLSPTMTPQEILETYESQIRPEAQKLNKSPKDSAAFLFRRLVEMSDQLGGAPQLFSIFDTLDSEGLTLGARNPELYSQVISAKNQAQATLDRSMLEASQEGTFRTLAELDQAMMRNPGAITVDLLAPMIGKFNVFSTAEGAHSYLLKAQALSVKMASTAALQAPWENREMGLLTPDKQQDVMEANLGPKVAALYRAASGSDPQATAALAQGLIQELSYRKVTVPMGSLERFIGTLSTTSPNKAGPDGGFLARAELYKAMAADPRIRDLYFKGDAGELMEKYTTQVATGSDPMAAYASAYEVVSPAAKEAAAKMAKDPESIKRAKAAVDEVVGSSFWPQLLGGQGRPGNADVVEMDAMRAMTEYARTHPGASSKELSNVAERFVASNYVHDTTTGYVVKVPPLLANEDTQKALSAYSERLMKANRLADRSDGDWKIQYRPQGTQGDLAIYMTNGYGSDTFVGTKPLLDIVREVNLDKHIQPNEGLRLRELQRQVASGSVDPAFIQANSDLLAKARGLRALPSDTFKAIDKLNSEAMLKRIREIPAMSFGKPDFSTLASPNKGSTIRVDSKLTATIAQQFAMAPSTVGNAHNGLAASLVTMGEGVMTQAYDDPAQGAGKNIGAGYNLKANEHNVRSDLKRAGVPEDQVEGVIDGTRQLTPDQVMRLTQVALPRYEKLAKETAEKTAPGLWDKMTPQQKAVMVDVAYQVGSTDQFKQAWKALAEGNAEAFATHARTTYVNRAGERVPDSRRNSLRAAMLAGTPQWNATVIKYGSLPNNALDVATLNTPKQ